MGNLQVAKKSSFWKHYFQPTIWIVTKQIIRSYGMGIFIFVCGFYVVADCLEDNVLGLSNTLLKGLRVIYWILSCFFLHLPPLYVLIIIALKIHCQGLLKSTKTMYKGRL